VIIRNISITRDKHKIISIPCFVKMYVCIAPVMQLAAAECIFE
jgi:hypothetical protein